MTHKLVSISEEEREEVGTLLADPKVDLTGAERTTLSALAARFDSAPEGAERVTLRRWVGDGMPPGPWESDPSIFRTADDTSEVEVRDFVPAPEGDHGRGGE